MSRPRRLPYPIRARTRFSEIVGAAGREAGGQLIGSAVEEAGRAHRRTARDRAGHAVIRLEILRRADRVPISIGTTWLPAARLPDAAADLSRDALDHAQCSRVSASPTTGAQRRA